MGGRWLLVLALLVPNPAMAAQTGADDTGVTRIVARLEGLLTSGNRDELSALVSPPISEQAVNQFALEFLVPDAGRGVALERDRLPLRGALPGDGYRLVIEFLTEFGDRARIMTARVDVSRPRDGDADSWRIVDLERLSVVEGLFRLRLDVASQLLARELTIDSEDFRLTLHEGSVFLIQSDAGITGLVLLGRGDMRFAPVSQTEKGQMRIFSGADALVTPFESAYVRLNPDEYATRVATANLTPERLDPRMVRRAREVFAQGASRSFNLDLGDLSRDQWFLIPPPGDFLADVRTRKHGTLTYARNANQAEDITLFNRARRRTISIYASAEKLASRGPSFDEDALADYDITSYEIDARIDPNRELVEGYARVTLRARIQSLATLTLRLADSLVVTSVSSVQFGRLLYLRVSNQNGVLINLPVAVARGTEITLILNYSGRLDGQRVEDEGVDSDPPPNPDDQLVLPENSYLLSNRSYWYPQNAVSDSATARMRIAVPDSYVAIASGQLTTGGDVPLREILAPPSEGRAFIFTAAEPVRYLALVVSRFVRVVSTTINARSEGAAILSEGASAGRGGRERIALAVEANPRQQSRAREVATLTEDIMQFYGTVMGDTPYASMTVALVENELPGGHSPGYVTVLNTPPPTAQVLWRNDPAAFIGFPEFFIAHELAHQWWGQAVGWKNYHEQWISEGFAQYFSALYAERALGNNVMRNMLRQFRRWSLAESAKGPISLGYRLGHIRGDTRTFRALVYNKGAGVLHMLRRLMGDEAFFRGLRRFYADRKFQKAGTDDLRDALETESGLPLGRFFDRWIYGADIPRLRYTSVIGERQATVLFEQLGDQVFDLPVTVTLVYVDGRTQDVIVPVMDKRVEWTIPTDGPVRQLQINRDFAALAYFDEP
ncbi:MAG: M1 family aminopeptidase [Vicinamibacterales bacterium]